MIITFLIVFGFYKSIAYLLELFSTLRRCFVRSPIDFQKTYQITKDSWCIITGASDGIGKQFAFDIAKQGLNVLLLGRNEEKLKQVQEEVQKLYPENQIKTFTIDFGIGHSPEYYKPFFEEIKSLKDIAMLINNAGVGGFRDYFLDYSEDILFEMVTVNCYSVSYLMKAIIPIMLQRQGRSGIINVSSVSCARPLPFCATYSGTKGFCDFLSRASAQEFLNKIDILCLRPNFVATKMTDRKPGGVILTTAECTEGCLKHLGYEYYTDGHWKRFDQYYWMMNSFISILPNFMVRQSFLKQISERKMLDEEACRNKKNQ